jgi:hypothetical protein
VLQDALVLPFRPDGRWGVFDAAGELVLAATNLRYPEGQLIDQSAKADLSAGEVAETVNDEELIYAGRLHSHYGHFIIESLSRLWPYAGRRPPARLLVHALEDKAYLFSCSYVSSALGALGVSEADVLLVDRPLRTRRLIVPGASFPAAGLRLSGLR